MNPISASRRRKVTCKAKFLTAAAVILIPAAAFLIWQGFFSPAARDFRRIAREEYDTVLLSMFPAEGYREEMFAYYRGMTLFKASSPIPNVDRLESYLKRIAKSGNTVTTAYLGIRPDKASPAQVQALAKRYPSTVFEVILSCPSSDYWQGLTAEEYAQVLSSYRDFLNAVPDIPEANFYFYGAEEWLVTNPANYQDQWTTAESVSTTIMLHSDRDHEYLVTEKNASALCSSLEELTGRLREQPEHFPDLSEYCIVFFGDSVIGNFTDSTSIPGVVAGFSGATVFNCGLGGDSAALGPESPASLSVVAGAFAQGDLSLLPEDTQLYRGVASFLETAPDWKELCFVLNYGINDYFTGCPVDSAQDPKDILTYAGAVRTAVEILRTSFPEARFLLCAPNYCYYFLEGTEPHGQGGYVLTDYVEAARSLSVELGTAFLDSYHDFGVGHDNWQQYLPDQVHPNAAFRLLIGKRLIELIP